MHESVSPSNYLREWFSNVRRQSYANELLAQCRACHAEMERTQRKMHEEQEAHRQRSRLGRFAAWWSPNDRPAPRAPHAARAWYSLVRMAPDAGEDARSSLLNNLESGWKGSRVWGLSATEDQSPTARKPKDTHGAAPGKGSAHDKEASRARQRQIDWEGFLAYAEFQERELYRLFHELDTNHDGVLDPVEIRAGFERAGIHPSEMVMRDFVASLASSGVSDVSELRGDGLDVRFPEFRDYLLLMPRKPTMQEIFRFYQVRKAVGLFGNEGIFAELGAGWGKTERGASAVTLDGDVSLAGEEQLSSTHGKAGARDARAAPAAPAAGKAPRAARPPADAAPDADADDDDDDDDEAERRDVIQRHVALKFLLAGGIAGAVSRTATAPLDRLKVYLMTSQETQGPRSARIGFGELTRAFGAIYRDGGLRGFWLGNGLNCVKIFPESAIKFFSYETSKRMFAKYVDQVSDARDISGFSRFMSGGIGGITSQLAIYPIETLKTRLMSSQTAASPLRGFALLADTARSMYTQGGFRAYYRGLGAGLVGVFPYSAIDMSTFEGIKLFYLKYTHKEDPGVIPLLMFGSISGSVGASTVYPLNLIRTRLQASGTPAHPRIYTSFFDAAVQTYRNEGPLGFYRGLIPSLAKVVPAVSISYVVYEQSKRYLHVQ
ncbi:hypothetical protein CBS14141_003855 [Malassezia furfur]|nr:hypothetical protein CBS14141_003855 [Malassezia furfur]